MCINDSTKIPDGSKCPAFALVTRCIPATVCGGSSGEKSGACLLLHDCVLFYVLSTVLHRDV